MLFGSRCYNLEMPMAALIALSMLALFNSGGFTRPVWSLLFGLAAGGAMLVKGVAFLYFLPPLLGLCTALIVRHFRAGAAHDNRLSLRQAVLFISTVVLGLGVALWWYRDGFQQLYQVITKQIVGYHQIYDAPLQTEGGQSAFHQIFWKSDRAACAGPGGFHRLAPAAAHGLGDYLLLGDDSGTGISDGPADLSRFLTASWPAFALAAAWLLSAFSAGCRKSPPVSRW
jgi:hypothetical protein